MKRISQTFVFKTLFSFALVQIFAAGVFAQTVQSTTFQEQNLFLGVKVRPEVRALIAEVERKTGKEVYAEYVEYEEGNSMFGTSFLTERGGTPVVRVNINLQNRPQLVEAVAAHELLHLKLRADDYPVFLFHPSVKTMRGLAQDVEQPNVNDLTSMIEHRIFKKEMEKFGLLKIINLVGDTERSAARRKGQPDGQSDTLNFARAVLEYPNAADVEKLRRIYLANGWHRSLKTGQEIADLISRTPLNSPQSSMALFKLCAAKLYPAPRPMKLRPDASVTAYRQMLIMY